MIFHGEVGGIVMNFQIKYYDIFEYVYLSLKISLSVVIMVSDIFSKKIFNSKLL